MPYIICCWRCSSFAQSCPWNPMNGSMPGFPVLYCLPELAQTHVHRVGDAIQPTYPLSSPSPPTFNLSQSGSFSSSHQEAKVLELQLQHQSFKWVFRVDFLYGWLARSPCCPRNSQESSPEPQFEIINFLMLILIYGQTLISVYDYWKAITLTLWTFVNQVMSLIF